MSITYSCYRFNPNLTISISLLRPLTYIWHSEE